MRLCAFRAELRRVPQAFTRHGDTRFFFTVTLDRPDLSRFVIVRYPRTLSTVLNVDEVGQLLKMAPAIRAW